MPDQRRTSRLRTLALVLPVFLACLAAAWPVSGADQEPGPGPSARFAAPGVELLHGGRYGRDPAYDPLAHGDEICPPVPFALLEETHRVPAAIGERFGAEFRISGEPGTVRAVTVRVRHPLWRDEVFRQAGRVETWMAWVCEGGPSYVGWEFTYDWELRPGPWVLEVVDDMNGGGQERVLLAVSFTVEEPGEDAPLSYELDRE